MILTDIEEIGEGAFAKVFRVEDDEGNQYAKKLFSPQSAIEKAIGKDDLKRRFIREVKYQDSLQHPNIVEIIEYNLEEDVPFFIMPLAECTLKNELDKDSTLSGNPNKALFDILAGLEIMHNNGFTHRDLKPANILKFVESGDIKYAISDFGLITSNHSESSTLTGTGAGGGTANYAAPELNGGFKRANFAADIYSFGAILHDIYGNKASRIPYTHLNSLPGEIGRIVSKCTKKLPIRRYKSVIELREDLYNVLDTQVIVFNSSSEENIINILKSKSQLSDDEWDELFMYIDECMHGNVSCSNIYASITAEHIKSLIDAPELFNALGSNFCLYILDGKGKFDFDYCDVLAAKAELFYNGEDIGLKAEVSIAVLILGTSHNRWYVEQKYMKMVNKNISDELANRIKIELDVQEIDFKKQISHLERSISASTNDLHPILQAYLEE